PKPTPTCALPWVAGVDQCVIPMYPNQTTMTFGSQVGGNDPSPPFMPYLQEIASCSPSCLPITYYQCQPSMCNPANTSTAPFLTQVTVSAPPIGTVGICCNAQLFWTNNGSPGILGGGQAPVDFIVRLQVFDANNKIVSDASRAA